MIKIGNDWVAAHQVARITPHPSADVVCVILVGGKELRKPVFIHEGQTREKVAAGLARQVDEEMRQCKLADSP